MQVGEFEISGYVEKDEDGKVYRRVLEISANGQFIRTEVKQSEMALFADRLLRLARA